MRVIHELARVQHVGVAGDRAHLGVGEALHQLPAGRRGSSTLSESTKATISALVARMPAAIAARLPRFSGKSITRTRGFSAATAWISASVPSVEPSLTTTISSFACG